MFLQDLHPPFGMVLVGSDFYVADSDALLRFHYRDGETQISAQDVKTAVKVTDLPAGPINHHWTKNVVGRAISPDYALGAHTGSLGLAFYNRELLPDHYRGGAFVGQHGSWNRKPRSGYKMIYVPFENGIPSGQTEDILTGFVNNKGEAMGRPVGVAIDRTGAVLVADDVGNRVWRVVPAAVKTRY